MYSQPPPPKRMAFSQRFSSAYSQEPVSPADDPWPLTIDTSMRSTYVSPPNHGYTDSPLSYQEHLDSKAHLLPPVGLDTPITSYDSSRHHSEHVSPIHSRVNSLPLPPNASSVPLQPRDESLHRPIPPPAAPFRTAVRTKTGRGSKSADQRLDPTWKGFIGSTYEALQLLEGCLRGEFRHMPRRAYDREREEVIRSGHVFVFEENASGIKRWTDGVAWSPSRLLPNFLIYREVEAKDHQPGEKKRAIKKRKRSVDEDGNEYDDPYSEGSAPVLNPNDMALSIPEPERRRLCGSLTDSYNFKSDGLVKKTISVEYKGNVHHIIAYYKLEDVIYGRLARMQDDPALREMTPRFELLNFHKFQGNPDNPMDDPIRFCNQMRTVEMPQQWLQYPSPVHHMHIPTTSHPSSLQFYPPTSAHAQTSDGFWPAPGAGTWSQQGPMIQTFTPISQGSHYSPQRSECGSHTISPMTPLSYSGPQLSQFPTSFGSMMPTSYNDGFLP